MATQTSPTTGQRYGVSRVCQIWALARSSFYAARQQKAAVAPPPPRQRPGPKPAITDEALLAAIHTDLKRSPWTGEGHRKVWARLRVFDRLNLVNANTQAVEIAQRSLSAICQRGGLFLANGEPPIGRQPVDGALDLEQGVDPPDGFQRSRRDGSGRAAARLASGTVGRNFTA